MLKSLKKTPRFASVLLSVTDDHSLGIFCTSNSQTYYCTYDWNLFTQLLLIKVLDSSWLRNTWDFRRFVWRRKFYWVSQGCFLRGECLSGMRGLKCTVKGSEVSWVYRDENHCWIRQQPWLWLCERQGVHETSLKLSSPSLGNEQPLPSSISLFVFPLVSNSYTYKLFQLHKTRMLLVLRIYVSTINLANLNNLVNENHCGKKI